jgi:hypothetical protein
MTWQQYDAARWKELLAEARAQGRREGIEEALQWILGHKECAQLFDPIVELLCEECERALLLEREEAQDDG